MNKLILNDMHVFLLLVWFVFVIALSASAQEKTSSVRDARAQVGDSFSDRQSQDLVTMNFTNIEIAALVKVLSEMTHRNFLVDERIMGKITVMTL